MLASFSNRTRALFSLFKAALGFSPTGRSRPFMAKEYSTKSNVAGMLQTFRKLTYGRRLVHCHVLAAVVLPWDHIKIFKCTSVTFWVNTHEILHIQAGPG
ncbi:hypothetical protein IW262DRAFT_320065 [Armillaria fumosa]|nr:hypothetical protein IW262DRAFT_320065 [Armillaria fumosa]